MAGGCRDCSRCTETGATSLMKLPFRAIALFWRIPLYMFKQKCPTCKHLMTHHTRLADGRFTD